MINGLWFARYSKDALRLNGCMRWNDIPIDAAWSASIFYPHRAAMPAIGLQS